MVVFETNQEKMSKNNINVNFEEFEQNTTRISKQVVSNSAIENSIKVVSNGLFSFGNMQATMENTSVFPIVETNNSEGCCTVM